MDKAASFKAHVKANWVPPIGLKDALEREELIKSSIKDINEQLQDPARAMAGTYISLDKEYAKWRSSCVAAKRASEIELGLTREWIKQNRQYYEDPAAKFKDNPNVMGLVKKKAALQLLLLVYQMCASLKRRGVQLLPEEQGVQDQIASFMNIPKQDMLATARMCWKGGVEEMGEIGEYIVPATRDPEDVAIVAKNYMRSFEPGWDARIRAAAAKSLVKAYLVRGEILEAIKVAEKMEASAAENIECWLLIADETGSKKEVDAARHMMDNLPLNEQVFGWKKVFEYTGDPKDLQQVVRTFEETDASSAPQKHKDAVRQVLLEAYLAWDLIEEARALLPKFTEPGRICVSAAKVAKASGEDRDLQKFMQVIAADPVKRLGAIKEAITTLTKWGRFDTARTLAEACEGTGKQCYAFAILASQNDNPNALDDLQRAERLSLGLKSTTETDMAALEIVRALINANRLEQAGEIAAAIGTNMTKCQACVMVYKAQQESAEALQQHQEKSASPAAGTGGEAKISPTAVESSVPTSAAKPVPDETLDMLITNAVGLLTPERKTLKQKGLKTLRDFAALSESEVQGLQLTEGTLADIQSVLRGEVVP